MPMTGVPSMWVAEMKDGVRRFDAALGSPEKHMILTSGDSLLKLLRDTVNGVQGRDRREEQLLTGLRDGWMQLMGGLYSIRKKYEVGDGFSTPVPEDEIQNLRQISSRVRRVLDGFGRVTGPFGKSRKSSAAKAGEYPYLRIVTQALRLVSPAAQMAQQNLDNIMTSPKWIQPQFFAKVAATLKPFWDGPEMQREWVTPLNALASAVTTADSNADFLQRFTEERQRYISEAKNDQDRFYQVHFLLKEQAQALRYMVTDLEKAKGYLENRPAKSRKAAAPKDGTARRLMLARRNTKYLATFNPDHPLRGNDLSNMAYNLGSLAGEAESGEIRQALTAARNIYLLAAKRLSETNRGDRVCTLLATAIPYIETALRLYLAGGRRSAN